MRPPELDALFAAFPVRPGKSRKERNFETAEAGRFTLGWGNADEPCLAVGYLPASKKLLRWVFPSAEPAAREDSIKPILRSVEPNDGTRPRYCAFGLDFRLPAIFRIEHAAIKPADVELLFESPQRTRAFFHRWGLPDALLAGRSLDTYYGDFLRSRGARVRELRRFSAAGIDGVEALYSQTGEHQMDRFMGRAWTNGVGRIWLDRPSKRLLACERIGPDNVELPAFETIVGGAHS